MKTFIPLQTLFNHSYKTNHLSLCQRNLKLLWPRLLSLWLAYSRQSISFVLRAIQGGRVALAEVAGNQRYLVGGIFLLIGAASIFFHQIFFDMNDVTRFYTWYYVNDFYYYFTLRPYIVLIFWTAGFLLYVPAKFKLAYIPFSLGHSVGWIGLIHYGLFVNNDIQFHQWPAWYSLVVGFSMGFAFIMSLDYLLYRHHHITRNNHSSFVGLTEMKGKTWEEKGQHFETLASNYRKINSRV